MRMSGVEIWNSRDSITLFTKNNTTINLYLS